MTALSEIKSRFATVLSSLVEDPTQVLAMIRPAGDPKFGDYQANCAMPLGKQLGKSPRDIAADLVAQVELDDLCEQVEIAGPGFINLTLKEDWLQKQLINAIGDEKLGIQKTANPRKFVVDYSSPNVAKPMHVGHIRSTVIGDAITKTLRFAGHEVISDNHLGDWGTQFGMIIYGYKNFLDQAAYDADPVPELSRLYKFVRMLVDYFPAAEKLPAQLAEHQKLVDATAALKSQPVPDDKKEAKKHRKAIGVAEKKIAASETKTAFPMS